MVEVPQQFSQEYLRAIEVYLRERFGIDLQCKVCYHHRSGVWRHRTFVVQSLSGLGTLRCDDIIGILRA
jgi:hypothetical protein